jgi:hypothetical protein
MMLNKQNMKNEEELTENQKLNSRYEVWHWSQRHDTITNDWYIVRVIMFHNCMIFFETILKV